MRRDTRLGREVALKLVSGSLGADAAVLERFEPEARLAGALNHPNVVALYDVGAHEGTSFLVTELLRGATLRERLDHGRLSVAEALEIGAQLSYAVRQGKVLMLSWSDDAPRTLR